MLKIGIDIRNIGKKRTGDEVVFFNLVKNLACIDSVNKYFLFTDITNTTLLHNMEVELGISDKKNFQVISLKCSNKFVWNFWTLPMHLRKNPVDIYQTQYITPFFVSKKIKIITVIHDISFNFFPKLIKFSDLFFLKLLIPVSLRRADKIIAVSEFTKNEIIKYYKINPKKVDFIYNAASNNFFRVISPEELSAVRKKYNLPKKFILYIGTMQPRKNLPVLIEAYAKVKDKLSGTRLVLAGNRNGSNFDIKIDQTIIKNRLENDIIFPGFIDEEDKPSIFKLASLFCYPSLYEGFAIPILEAMISKIPVLASDIPAHREIGGNGIMLFNLKQSENLAEKLSKIFKENGFANDLIGKAQIQSKKFSWEKSAKETIAIYKKIIMD